VLEILTKLHGLYKHIKMPEFNVQSILCRWEDVRKNITSMLKKSPKHVWSEVGGSHQDSTSAYSEMPGELDIDYHEHEPIRLKDLEQKERKKQLDQAMQAPIDQDRIRKAGW